MNIKFWESVRYVRDGLLIRTVGLAKRGQDELGIEGPTEDLINEAEEFLRFTVRYLSEEQTRILDGQTLNYGYWLVKFKSDGMGTLWVWEYNQDGSEFVPGGAFALRCWKEQHSACANLRASFVPPNPGQLTAVSPGVLEGDSLEGVRYPSPSHMSGWWLLGSNYNGDVGTVKTVHTHHVTKARPDLIKYLALPFGTRFDLRTGEKVWFDHEAASQPPAE
jgi:hypothetical protein